MEDETYFGDRPGRYLGRRVGRAGRIDGSNLADSAAEDPENVGYDRGRVYLLAKSETTAVPTTQAQGVAFVGATPNPATSDVNLTFSPERRVLREHANAHPRAGSKADLAGPHALTRRAPPANPSLVITGTSSTVSSARRPSPP